MKLILTCCALLLFSTAATGDDMQIDQEINDLNTLLEAATAKYDVATLSKYVTDDFVLVNGGGEVWNRDAFLKDIGDRTPVWLANDPSEVTIRSYNDNCAVLVGLLHIKYRLDGKVHDLLARYTNVWVRLDGKWRFASGQATVYKRL